MSDQFWKNPRSNSALVKQWARRVLRPRPFILEEVERRMIARAQIMRPVEGGVLHQGWLHPESMNGLQALFQGRSLSAVVPAPVVGLFQLEESKPTWWKRFLGKTKAQKANCTWLSDEDRSILPANSFAMVWSPLWLHAIKDPASQIAQWQQSLKPDGGVFFTALGPDTAKQLTPFANALGVSLPDYPDMHDLGDLLSSQGFSDPVMEMERLTLTYASADSLLNDWRALHGNNLSTRSTATVGKAAFLEAKQALQTFTCGADGRLSLTLELIYGHAWKVERKAKQGVATVALADIGGRKVKKI